MSLRIGVLSTAHVHAPSFVSSFGSHPMVKSLQIWDDQVQRGQAFAKDRKLTFESDLAKVLTNSDAVVICSENVKHVDLIEAAVAHKLHVLCEKPIAANKNDLDKLACLTHDENLVLMTAFPCPFSPTFQNLKLRVEKGEIGRVLSVCSTNQGTCPFGWFVDPALSGGGAMIDHVVHVMDLLRRLLGENPNSVQAQIGNKMYSQNWDDVAMVTVGFPSGVFATIDSSWSKPKGYKTWGNVTMNVVGDMGVMEADLFVQGMDIMSETGIQRYSTGSNLDGLMVGEFMDAIADKRRPSISLDDGVWASKVAIGGYESVANGGKVVAIS